MTIVDKVDIIQLYNAAGETIDNAKQVCVVHCGVADTRSCGTRSSQHTARARARTRTRTRTRACTWAKVATTSLRITGLLKKLIIAAGGDNVALVPIEDHLLAT